MAAAGIRVEGLAELHRALRLADRQQRLGIRKAERQVAEPVAREAEQLAVRQISHIGVPWSRMRIGITQKLVYVAPKQRGSKARRARVTDARRKADKKFARRLAVEAMHPAEERHRERTRAEFQNVLDTMADNFNKG